MDLTIRPGPGSATCVVCRDDLRADAIACAGCGARFHLECRAKLARCSTPGCTGAPADRPPAPPPPAIPGMPTAADLAPGGAGPVAASGPLSPAPGAPGAGAPPTGAGAPSLARARRAVTPFVPPRDLAVVVGLCVAAALLERTVLAGVLMRLSDLAGRPVAAAWYVVPTAWLAWRARPGTKPLALAALPALLVVSEALGRATALLPSLVWTIGWQGYALMASALPGLTAALVGGLLRLFGPPAGAELVGAGGPDPPDTVSLALRPDERVLWVGAPDPALAARDGLLSGAGVVALILAAGLLGAGGEAGAVACVVSPLCVGFVAFLVAVFTHEAWRTVYALTDQRALAIDARTSQARDIADAARVREVRERRFGGVLFVRTQERRPNGRVRTREDGFLHLADPAPVARLLRELAAKNG